MKANFTVAQACKQTGLSRGAFMRNYKSLLYKYDYKNKCRKTRNPKIWGKWLIDAVDLDWIIHIDMKRG